MQCQEKRINKQPKSIENGRSQVHINQESDSVEEKMTKNMWKPHAADCQEVKFVILSSWLKSKRNGYDL